MWDCQLATRQLRRTNGLATESTESTEKGWGGKDKALSVDLCEIFHDHEYGMGVFWGWSATPFTDHAEAGVGWAAGMVLVSDCC